jgi:hypothetical protein
MRPIAFPAQREATSDREEKQDGESVGGRAPSGDRRHLHAIDARVERRASGASTVPERTRIPCHANLGGTRSSA